MYQSFRIKNFRCFRDLTLEPLARVNLIAGMNNVGKTALLEALFLHIGPNNPDLSLRINAIRGIERLPMDAEEIWGWLFFRKNTKEAIELTSVGQDGEQRTLRIRLEGPQESEIISPVAPPRIEGSLTTLSRHGGLVMEYGDSSGQIGTSRAFITIDGTETKLQIERARLAPLPVGVFSTTRQRFPREDAERFSSLERVGREREVLNALQILEPHLRRLAVLTIGGMSMIHGDIGIGELVPLPIMGEGMVRLVSVVLAIANAPHGTVLIDEIENGLHYSVMMDVWKAIAYAARQADAQVFATTHSWECIQAAHLAFESTGTYDFCLHRLDRLDGDIQAVTYDQAKLGTAIMTDLEVR